MRKKLCCTHWMVGVGLSLQMALQPVSAFDGSGLYQPHAAWVGRLILPTDSAWPLSSPPPRDWVWIELQEAPAAHRVLLGRRLPLTWQADPEIDRLVRLVTTAVRFTPEARQAVSGGWILPERLDGRSGVGPLVSLAGARPVDDLLVSLERVQVEPAAVNGAVLRLARPPIQIAGRYKALFQVLGPDPQNGPERYLVRHFNRQSHRFDGRLDSVRIPESPLNSSRQRRHFSPVGLVGSSAGHEGWYAFGEPDAKGVFTVASIQPRALVRLQPDLRVNGAVAGDNYLHQRQWEDLSHRRGHLSRAWIQASAAAPAMGNPPWQVGDQALVLHLFGNMGGPNGELQMMDDLFGTGHFSFGLGQVIRDSLSDQPILSLRYFQIYGHNQEGIVSGTIDWSAYMGDFRRGWMQLRPVSDVLVWFDPLRQPMTQNADPERTPLRELALQSEVMMARYRTGDGTGFASISLLQSCVQDSSQTLFITLERLRREAEGHQALAGNGPQLRALAAGVSALVAPSGTVREDWAQNASLLLNWPSPNPAEEGTPFRRGELIEALKSRRSILPRRAQDELSRLMLGLGADLWVLRTTQIPAPPPGVTPIPPGLLEP